MHIKSGQEVGIYFIVGQNWSTLAEATNTPSSEKKKQKTVLVHLVNPGIYKAIVCIALNVKGFF